MDVSLTVVQANHYNHCIQWVFFKGPKKKKKKKLKEKMKKVILKKKKKLKRNQN